MKISIITTSFNSAKTIEDTLKSVIGQTHSNIEYIIIDGGSTDGTLDIIEKYRDKITTIISEKDAGIYNAMNKGVRLATGDIVGILNSDDVYTSSVILERVVTEFENKNIDCVWGDLLYVKKENIYKVVRRWKSSPYRKGFFQKGWHPPHPTFFVKKEAYEKYGLFREDMPIAADYELMLRFLERYAISSSYIPETLVRMRVGGTSNKSILNIMKGNKECLRAFKINHLKVSPLIFLKKPSSKILQYFFK